MPPRSPSASETLVMEPASASPEAAPATTVGEGDRLGDFEVLGLLGEGGMGQVLRVHDPVLHRAIAMKVLRGELMVDQEKVALFLKEAQLTARLQHPGIVPVHQLGQLEDGRWYFTMQEVVGRTLNMVIRDVHRASGPTGWSTGQGWSMRRLVNAFYEVCEAVAYAHANGVVHRDLKPGNVMLGEHGEVVLLDWGIATIVADRSAPPGARGIAGSPAWMSPEQARGEHATTGPASDVWALGAILYYLLYGVRPYHESRGLAVLQSVLVGPPEPPRGEGPPVPPQLEEIWRGAMRMDPEQRYPNANALAAEVLRWLDGSTRREDALALVTAARLREPKVAALRAQSAGMRAEAARRLVGIPRWAPESQKVSAWSMDAKAQVTDEVADLLDIEIEELLLGAVAQDPDLVEGHLALADRWRRAHGEALAMHDAPAARRAEARLRSHLAKLPRGATARQGHEAWLRGEGIVRLVTTPPGVPGMVERYVVHFGRLVATEVSRVPRTPVELELPVGSYRLRLDRPGGQVVYLPFVVERGEAYSAHEVVLPMPGELGPNDVLVPAGFFWRGGDVSAVGGRPRARAWVDSFVMRRYPVTNHEYVEFLHALVAEGREEEALRYAPREKAGTVGEIGSLIYGYEGGRFSIRADADGDLWQPEWPVMMVDWHGATAYAAWFAARTGKPWRLPTDIEWGKVARGVDGRFHPWGDGFDPSWCNMSESRPERPLPVAVTDFEIDESPYGVRGLGGNVRDWCADADAVTFRRVNRGGFWIGNARDCRSADRHMHEDTHRGAEIGFRLARSL